MTRQKMKNLVKQFILKGDVYRVQRRPLHSHIVINDDYHGIRIIDPWSGADVLRVGFTEEYRTAGGAISGWCLRSDGDTALVLNEEPRMACWLPLKPEGGSCNVVCPPFQHVANLSYLWETDSFWITDGKSHDFYELQWREGLPIFVANEKVRIVHPAWSRTLERLPLEGCNVMRVESDKSQILYHCFGDSPRGAGMLNWRSGVTWFARVMEDVQRLAFHEDRMFVMYDYEVHALNGQGQVETVYPAPNNFRYSGLDTLPAKDMHPAALVLICWSQHDPHLNQCLVYQLE